VLTDEPTAARHDRGNAGFGRGLLPVPAFATFMHPIDLDPFVLVWFVAMCAAIWSVVLLLGVVIRIVAGERKAIASLSVGPVAAIAILFLSMMSLERSFAMATRVAAETAQRVQKQCIANRVCPVHIAGWSSDRPGQSRTTAGWPGRRYWITYRVSDDLGEFSIVAQNLDDGKRYSGGVRVPMTTTTRD
jgi:hypothetical protein